MRRFRRPQPTVMLQSEPRPGDSMITLMVSADQDLLERTHLLTYSFAKVIQGSMLRQIVEWDLTNGRIRFIVAGGPSNPSPVGQVTATLQDVDDDAVAAKIEPYKQPKEHTE